MLASFKLSGFEDSIDISKFHLNTRISAISVFDSESENRFLDWVYNDFEIDIDATNNKLDFTEDGSTELT